MRFWPQNGHRMAPQTIQKRSKKVYHFSIVFFIDFWIDLGGRNPWKWAPRVHEKLIFIKSPFPILTYFWKQKWWKKAPKMEPKWLKKSIKKSDVFLIDLGPIFGGFWEHFGGQNSSKNRVENLVFFWRSKNESWSRLWRSKGGPGVFGGPQACLEGAPRRPGQMALVGGLAPPNNQKPKNWWLWALGL